MNESISNFHFRSDFDSGNLARVVKLEKDEAEFNLWTLPDCANTVFENGNRTWFYFSVKGPCKVSVKFNLMNLNRQAKLYSQGMKPLYKILPHQPQWERIKEKPVSGMEDQGFIMSFRFTMPCEENATVFFAFCSPYSYTELQTDLEELDAKFSVNDGGIYYKRDLLCRSLEQRRVDVLTVTRKGDENSKEKRVVFVSARVHPGETPSSFVLKGFLDFILKEDDIRAQKLREKFIFILVPMLNPDGVYRGHYRTDSRGVNLNRVYLDTLPEWHPTISATKQLILDLTKEDLTADSNSMSLLEHQVKEALIMPTEDSSRQDNSETHWPTTFNEDEATLSRTSFAGIRFAEMKKESTTVTTQVDSPVQDEYFCDKPLSNFDTVANVSNKNRLFTYIDLHGHASKRGIFIYGNHFKDTRQQTECLLFPKLISLNSQHFDFWACNFTEKNMRSIDRRDGLSKEGSGRVGVHKLTGITRSYTLECNYNTGRMCNILSPLPTDKFPLFHATTADAKEDERWDSVAVNSRRRTVSAGANLTEAFAPAVPYTIDSFQEVGEAMAISLLDLIGANPLSRLSQSMYGDVEGVRHWIRLHCLGQRPFPFVEADIDDESAGSHITSTQKSEQLLQVAKRESYPSPGKANNTGTKHSPGKSPNKSKDASNVRRRVPWPCSSKHNKSETPPNRSPIQGVVAVDLTGPTSPTSYHFPKQPKIALTPRRLVRKKSLRKPKVVKKELVDAIEGVAIAPGSPPKMLKRKRRKSRSISETKEKRKFKMTASPESVEEVEDVVAQGPSTSTTSQVKRSKSPLIKKKKIIRKRNAAATVLKKKRIVLSD